jgi:hypothetical protein
MMANHKAKEYFWNGNTIKLQPGQFVTGRKILSEKSGINESKVERILNCFESEQQIEQRKTSTSRLISIRNWSKFQESEQRFEQRVNNRRTTSEQRVNTKQECKNDKNDKNVRRGSIAAFAPPSPDQVRDYFFEIGINGQEFEKFHDYYTGNGWKVGRNQMKDWKAACRNWKRKMTEFKEKNNGKQSVAKDRIESIREWGERMAAGGNSGQ